MCPQDCGFVDPSGDFWNDISGILQVSVPSTWNTAANVDTTQTPPPGEYENYRVQHLYQSFCGTDGQCNFCGPLGAGRDKGRETLSVSSFATADYSPVPPENATLVDCETACLADGWSGVDTAWVACTAPEGQVELNCGTLLLTKDLTSSAVRTMTGSDVCLNGTTTGILGATCTETFSFTCVCAQVDCQLGRQQYASSCPADNGCIQADVATDYGRSPSYTVRPDSFKPVNPGGTALTPMAVYTSRFAAAGSDSDINVFSVVAQEAADVYVTELRLADDVTDGPWLPLTTAFPTLLASSTSNFGKSNVASVLTSRGGGAHTATMFVGDVGVASNNGTVFWMNVGIGDAIGGGCCSFDTGSSGTISAPAEAGIVGFGTRVLFRWRTLAMLGLGRSLRLHVWKHCQRRH